MLKVIIAKGEDMSLTNQNKSSYALALLRVGLGYIFLWAFLDKLIGLKFATCADKAIGCSQSWLEGGSPTAGFLGHATTGPLANFYQNLAGNALIDWAFMLGLLFVGVGLLFGTWIKSAAVAGIAMMALMWSSLLWPVNTPGVDEHIIYILVMAVFLFSTGKPKLAIKLPFIKLP